MQEIINKLIDKAKKNNFKIQENEYWIFLNYQDGVRATQGWKIHMNSIMPQVPLLIEKVSSYCFLNGLSWKF